jgi:hypothetical protein
VGTQNNPSCQWTLSTPHPEWITLGATSASSPTGSGDNPAFPFSVQQNSSPTQRTSLIQLQDGTSVQIVQDGLQCSYTLSPSTQNVAAGASNGSFQVVAPAGSGSACQWRATSNAPWLTVTSGSPNVGSQTVSYSVAANANATSQTGNITVTDLSNGSTQVFTVYQGAAQCNYEISPGSVNLPSGASSGSFQVNTQAGCNWTATPQNSWITVPAASAVQSGSGTVNFNVAANNTSAQRPGSITVPGQTFNITQAAGVTCTPSLSQNTISAPSAAGSYPILLSINAGCQWNAQANQNWLSIDNTSGTTTTTINVSVANNTTTGSRTGTVTIDSLVVTVNQGAPTNNPPPAPPVTASFSASPDPVPACNGQQTGTTTFSWNAPGASGVQLHQANASGTVLYQGSSNGTYQSTSVTDGEVVVLTDLSGNVLGQVTINLDHACGVSLSQAVVTPQTSWPNGACAVPNPRTSYSSQDSTVTLWFELQNVSAGSQIVVNWIDPYGNADLQNVFNLTAGAPQYCNAATAGVFYDYPNGFVPATLPGGWTAQISVNGNVLGTFPYYISGPLTYSWTLTSNTAVSDFTMPPAPTKSFNTTDNGLYTYFATLNSQAGDVNKLYYYRWDPTAQTWDFVVEHDFPAIPSSGAYAFQDELSIAGNSVVQQYPGYWGILASVVQGGTETDTFQEIVSITPPATMLVNPSSLNFNYIIGGPAPAAQTVSVTSNPSGTTFSGVINNGSPWLSGSLSGTVTPATLTVNANPAGVALGSYNDSITLTGGNSSATIPITFTVANPVPVLSSISPTSIPMNSGAVQLQANGQNFTSDAHVHWFGPNGGPSVDLQTQFQSATLLQATLPASYLTSAGTAQVSVDNSLGTSNSLAFLVTPPTPSISSLSPNSVTAGSPQTTLTVNGSNFINGAQVLWTGVGGTNTLQTQFQSSNLLHATIPASYLASPGLVSISVSNAGVSSNTASFQITAGQPQITSLSPNSVVAQVATFNLLVLGAGFTSTSTVLWNGSPLITTYISPTELSGYVLSSLTSSLGNVNITVRTGSQTSNSSTLTVVRADTAFFGLMVTKSAPPSDGSCGNPVGASAFLTSDAMVYLYFTATVSQVDNLSNDWVAPDGSVIQGGTWGTGNGNFCFTGASLEIDQTPPSRLGAWQARVYDNGSLVFWVPFTISVN